MDLKTPDKMLREEYEAEACRDFLVHELGIEIPRFYRYAEGIHEVQKRILLRYGDENFAKAMGIFKELLELDSNACGLGDDGDLWRSWRHDYKLRGENLADPGTPRFSGLILPAAVSPRRSGFVPTSQDQRFNFDSPNSHRQSRLAQPQHPPVSPDQEKQPAPGSQASWTPQQHPLAAWANNTAAPSTGRTSNDEARSSKTSLRKIMTNNISTFFSREKEHSAPPMSPKDDRTRPKKDERGRQTSPRKSTMCFDGAYDVPDEAETDCSVNSNSRAGLLIDPDRAHSLAPLGPRTNSSAPSLNRSSDRSTTATMQTSLSSTDNYTRTASSKAPPSPSNAHHIAKRTTSLRRPPVSNKDRFRNATRDLLEMESPTPSSSIMGNFSPLDPAKYSPPPNTGTSIEHVDPYSRYASVAFANPFDDERTASFRFTQQEQAQLMGYSPVFSPPKPKGISQSRSTGSIAPFHPYCDPFTESRTYNVGNVFDDDELSPRRGRSTSPVKRPVRYLDNVPDDEHDGSRPQSPTKRSRSPMKKMFGENGWLGKSTSMYQISSEHQKKNGLKHWSGKIKQRVEGLTEDVNHLLESPFVRPSSGKAPTQSQFPVSIDPYSQSVLTSQIEIMISVTANSYLLLQHEHGRMSPETLVKVMEFWKSKGRPQVIEFQFDQATQRDLIVSNLKTFTFFGKHAIDWKAWQAVMQPPRAASRTWFSRMALHTQTTMDVPSLDDAT